MERLQILYVREANRRTRQFHKDHRFADLKRVICSRIDPNIFYADLCEFQAEVYFTSRTRTGSKVRNFNHYQRLRLVVRQRRND